MMVNIRLEFFLYKNKVNTVVLLFLVILNLSLIPSTESGQLKYVWGDAFDDPLVNGPDGSPYPWDAAAKIASKQRNPRMFNMGFDAPEILSPKETRDILLKAFQAQERGEYLPGTSFMSRSMKSPENKKNLGQPSRQSRVSHRQGRVNNEMFSGNTTQSSSSRHIRNGHNNVIMKGGNKRDGDSATTLITSETPPIAPTSEPQMEGCVPSRLCASTYNTTAPLYGVSLTSGQPVTIVQKFPDLLQQVVFQVCKTSECEVIQGECVQTYLPYLFLVIPLGPVTLTGQDYVLVESGCVCRPKYARRHDEPPPLPFIQPLNH